MQNDTTGSREVNCCACACVCVSGRRVDVCPFAGQLQVFPLSTLSLQSQTAKIASTFFYFLCSQLLKKKNCPHEPRNILMGGRLSLVVGERNKLFLNKSFVTAAAAHWCWQTSDDSLGHSLVPAAVKRGGFSCRRENLSGSIFSQNVPTEKQCVILQI